MPLNENLATAIGQRSYEWRTAAIIFSFAFSGAMVIAKHDRQMKIDELGAN